MEALTIISGGQTGVDRTALDVALSLGLPCGGYCPAGRRAEDGVIPVHYPLKEGPSASYLVRTVQNILTTDATLIIFHAELVGGTLATKQYAKLHEKPLLCLDAAKESPAAAASKLRAWIRSAEIRRLNVAGPRVSQSLAAALFARAALFPAFRGL